ncbi:MAG: hypothetical protein QW726_02150 [Fervidicoccaceae archaeon]
MSVENVNIIAWDFAIEYVEWNEKKGFKSPSNRMLQKIFSAFGEKDPLGKIKEIAAKYSPPEGKEKKRRVEEFCGRLLKELEKMSLEDGKILVTYLMWNVKTLEAKGGPEEKLKSFHEFLNAEGVPEKKIGELVQKLKQKLGSLRQEMKQYERKRRW